MKTTMTTLAAFVVLVLGIKRPAMQHQVITNTVKTFVFLLTTTVITGSAHALVIDSFETSQSLMAASFMVTDSGSVIGPGIIGDERDAVVTWTSGPVFSELDVISAGTGFLSFSLGANTLGSAALTWDGDDNSSTDDFTGLGGSDLTDSNMSNAMLFDIVSDDNLVDLSITVWTDASDASSAILSLPGGIVSSTDFSVLFASFSPILGSGADFANVGMIRVEIDAALVATDLLIESVRTGFIPEPSTLTLAACALIGLAYVRRRP